MRASILPIVLLLAVPTVTRAEITIGFEDFDGGAVGLISSSVPTQDGGGGDTFAVGATAAWTTSGGTPFGLVDNSVGAVGDSTFFAGDTEGVFGVNSNFTNNFLGISDSDEFGNVVATWNFNIAGATGLGLQIGMGSMEGSSTNSYSADTVLTWTVSIDGGAAQNAFNITADASGDGYSYRALDNGTVVVANDNALLVSGSNPVSKLLAEDGSLAGNTFLDKTPASGPGAGILDTFATSLNGQGNVLTLTLTANLPFEAVAFDNIRVTAVPEPSALGLVALVAPFVMRRRRVA